MTILNNRAQGAFYYTCDVGHVFFEVVKCLYHQSLNLDKV